MSAQRAFSFGRFAAMVQKEFVQMRRDRLTFAMMVGIPLMQLVLFAYAINLDPKHLPTAVVLADQWLPGLSGAELLGRVRTMHPDARRALLVPWGAWSERRTADAILRAMAVGDINYYVLKPWS